MKRAEQIAWAVLAGLVTIFVILLAGGFKYHVTVFWTGALLTGGQSIVVGLALWGLRLAQQAAELRDLSNEGPTRQAWQEPAAAGFRMSAGDDGPASRGRRVAPGEGAAAAETLETGFQRISVATAGIILTGLAGVSSWIIYVVYQWAAKNPEITVPIVGLLPTNLDKYAPEYMDNLALLIGVGAAAIYGALFWIARPKRRGDDASEAVFGVLTMGLSGMVALAVGTILAFFKVAYASEVAAIVITFFMLLEGLELIINACRSYSSVEEMDQDAVDLQALPLVPMLSSLWLGGLRMLLAQSVGLSGEASHERGVIARMMPRALLAIVIIAIGASCLRVVPAGEVAVLERFGEAQEDANHKVQKESLLQPGLHFTLPWPIDELVPIPTERLQMTSVGTELHASKAWRGVDFQFWKFRDDSVPDKGVEDLFVTGDPGSPQILETFVQVQWRVTDPVAFYTTLSHSDFFEKTGEDTKALPIYEAIVQQCTSFAVTRVFAIHSLEQVLISDRHEVEDHCRQILQEKLDSLGASQGLPNCGITVQYLTIKDLHPPYGGPDQPNDPSQRVGIGGMIQTTPTGINIIPYPDGRSKMIRGPASAFEFVISMREFHDQLIAMANGEVTAQLSMAKGDAESEKNNAEAYRLEKIARAHGDGDRLKKMMGDQSDLPPEQRKPVSPEEQKRIVQIMKQRLLYQTIKDTFDPVMKIIVDQDAKHVHIYQNTDKGPMPLPPAR